MRHDPDNNLQEDIVKTAWMVQKVIDSDTYAQNLYAAMCNNVFQKNDVWPRLADLAWSCSWRYAGGIIADIRKQGDYMDWYCSGMGSGLGNGDPTGVKCYVTESTVTDEIRQDLFSIGWTVEPYTDN
jgi:hypothetical protein